MVMNVFFFKSAFSLVAGVCYWFIRVHDRSDTAPTFVLVSLRKLSRNGTVEAHRFFQ